MPVIPMKDLPNRRKYPGALSVNLNVTRLLVNFAKQRHCHKGRTDK